MRRPWQRSRKPPISTGGWPRQIQAPTCPHFAAALNSLGIALAKLGRRKLALAAAEEAVVIRRQLANTNAAAYLPHLADSLARLSGFFWELGRRTQALAAAEEAADVYRRLTQTTPGIRGRSI